MSNKSSSRSGSRPSGRLRTKGQGRRPKRSETRGVSGIQSELSSFFKPSVPQNNSRAPEIKSFLAAEALTTTTSTGRVVKLSTIAQGVGQNQRVGDQVSVLGVRFAVQMYGHATGLTTLRVLILQWMDNDGTNAPTTAQVLAYVTAVYAPSSPYLQTGIEQQDFSVLHDSSHALGPSTYAKPDFLKFQLKRRGRIGFDPGATTGTGHYYVLFISDAVALLPQSAWTSEILYQDS